MEVKDIVSRRLTKSLRVESANDTCWLDLLFASLVEARRRLSDGNRAFRSQLASRMARSL